MFKHVLAFLAALGLARLTSAADLVCAVIDPDKSERVTLLEAKLLAEAELRLVDRAQVDKVLQERQLQAVFGASAVKERVQLGQVLKADVLLQVRVHRSQKGAVLELVVSETAGGLRLLMRAIPETDNATADVDTLLEFVRLGLKKSKEPIRTVVAVPPFVSQDLTFENDHLKSSYAKLVEGLALSRSGVVVVEFAEAEALARELALAAPGSALQRPLPVYLLGDYRHVGLGDKGTVTLKLRAEQGGKAVVAPSERTVPPAESPAELRKWATLVLDAASGVAVPPADPKTEARMLANRAGDFRRLAIWSEAHALIEASLLLDPKKFELHPVAMAVLQNARDHEWKFGDRESDHIARATRLHQRGLWHLEMFLGRGGDLTPYGYPRGTGLLYFYLQIPQPTTQTAAESKALIDTARREQREILLRLIPKAAKQRNGAEGIFLQAATAYLPPRDRWLLVEQVVRQLQELPDCTERVIAYCNPDMLMSMAPLNSTEFREFLARLAKDRNQDLRAAGERLTKRLEMDLQSRTPQLEPARPDDVGRIAGRNVTLQPAPVKLVPKATGSNGRIQDIISAGTGVDVLNVGGSLYVMKRKGQAKRIWESPERFPSVMSLTFDGRCVWAVTARKGVPLLLAIDPETEKVHEVGEKHGLPQPPAGQPQKRPYPVLIAAGLSPGRACVTGSFAGRAWVGVATLLPSGEPTVKVFHEARVVSDRATGKASTGPEVAFEPAFAMAYQERPLSMPKVLIGRGGILAIPMIVDPERETVSVFPSFVLGSVPAYVGLCFGEKGTFYYTMRTTLGGKPVRRVMQFSVTEGRSELTEGLISAGDPGSADVVSIYEGGRVNLIVTHRKDSGGKPAYVSQWWQFDPATKTTRLLAIDLPPLQHIGRSSHYGLVALGRDAQLLSVVLEQSDGLIADPLKNPPRDPGDPETLKPVWTAPAQAGTYVGTLLALPDANLVILHNSKVFPQVFDAKTGAARPKHFQKPPAKVDKILPMTQSRFATLSDEKIIVWDAKTGRSAGTIPMPKMAEGPARANFPYFSLSPEGKYLVAARTGLGRTLAKCPFHVIDTASGKVLLDSEWSGGTAHFTSDSSRLLVAEANGKCRWYALPSCERSDGWEFSDPMGGSENKVTGISDDGKVVSYYGPRRSRFEQAAFLINGQNGESIRAYSREYHRSSATPVTGDGQRIALMRVQQENDATIDVLTHAGPPVARARISVNHQSLPGFVLSRDGRSLVIYDYRDLKLYKFDLP